MEYGKFTYKDKIKAKSSSGDLIAARQGLKNVVSINQHTENTRPITVNGVADFGLTALLTHSTLVLKCLTSLIIALLAVSPSNLLEKF